MGDYTPPDQLATFTTPPPPEVTAIAVSGTKYGGPRCPSCIVATLPRTSHRNKDKNCSEDRCWHLLSSECHTLCSWARYAKALRGGW